MAFHLLRIWLRYIGCLPLGVARSIGAASGRLTWLFNLRPARLTRRNIDLCFRSLPSRERERLVRSTVLNTGRFAAEAAVIWNRGTRELGPEILAGSCEQLLAEAHSRGKGVLILAPHLGNWEVLNLYLGSRYPFTAVFKPLSDPGVDRLVRSLRSRTGSRLVPATAAGIRKLVRALRQGELAGLMPDQVPARHRGVYAPFFGIPTLTTTLAGWLISKTRPEVLLGYTLRQPRGSGYNVVFQSLTKQLSPANTVECARTINAAIEQAVRSAPSQYNWAYNRFRHSPALAKLAQTGDETAAVPLAVKEVDH